VKNLIPPLVCGLSSQKLPIGEWCHVSIIHLNTIVRGAHLLPHFPSDTPVYREINYMNVLDIYCSFYVNKYIDHHAFEIAF
jgi:hypothetical protein